MLLGALLRADFGLQNWHFSSPEACLVGHYRPGCLDVPWLYMYMVFRRYLSPSLASHEHLLQWIKLLKGPCRLGDLQSWSGAAAFSPSRKPAHPSSSHYAAMITKLMSDDVSNETSEPAAVHPLSECPLQQHQFRLPGSSCFARGRMKVSELSV